MYVRKQPEHDLLNTILAEAQTYAEQGFEALKIKVGKNLAFDKLQVREMRKAFPKLKLMADSNHAYSLPEAVEMGRVLEAENYSWFEEPLSPEHPELFQQLAEKVDVAIATGECEQTRWGFQDLLSKGGVQIAQPDMAYCGGPTEAVKIRTLASSYGINVVPHCWGTQLNLACAAHFLATTYVEPGRAEVAEPLLELDRTPNPMRDEMYSAELEIHNGVVSVPTAPGLGVEPDRAAIEGFCVQKTENSDAG
jgi:D-galactarolactone cycloisomerase